MTEKKSRFHFWDHVKGKGGKEKQLNIDEEALREFEAVLHAELEAEDMELEKDEPVKEDPGEVLIDSEDEEENLEELEREVERVCELQPSVLQEAPQEMKKETLPVRTPLEDSLEEQLEELSQIKLGLPEERREWIHEQAVKSAGQKDGEVHYRRRRRQQPTRSTGKWIWIFVIILCGVAIWFFRGKIAGILPSFEREQTVEVQDSESLLRTRIELFFSTAKVIEAESMTSFFSMTTMGDPQNYDANRESINALIDLKTSFELVQELQYLGISKVSIEEADGQPIRAIAEVGINSVDPVLKGALSETTWQYQDGQWVFDAEAYVTQLSNARITEGQLPIQTIEDHSDLPVGEVVVEEPVEESPATELVEGPEVEKESPDGFIQAGGYSYESEDERTFSMLTLKFGIQREGFEKMVFTSTEAKSNQRVDAPSFQLWLSEDNRQMTVKVDARLNKLEIADYERFSAMIKRIEVEQETGILVFTFDSPTQVRPYEWKGLLIIDYEEKQ